MRDFSFSYPRYLDAKETIDQRSLSRLVWTTFLDRLSDMNSPLHVLEVGGGTGATLRRILGAIQRREVQNLNYTLLDSRTDNLDTARTKTKKWAREVGFVPQTDTERASYRHDETDTSVSISFEEADLFRYTRREAPRFDAIVAQAVLDLYNIPDALRCLRSCLTDGGAMLSSDSLRRTYSPGAARGLLARPQNPALLSRADAVSRGRSPASHGSSRTREYASPGSVFGLDRARHGRRIQ